MCNEYHRQDKRNGHPSCRADNLPGGPLPPWVSLLFGVLAQLVEHQLCKLDVILLGSVNLIKTHDSKAYISQVNPLAKERY